MNNSIVVAYPLNSANQVTVDYSVEQAENVHIINCSVHGAQCPLWLQLRKFSITSIEKQGSFTTLFSEVNNSKNLDTTLFIDMVYAGIMQAERRKHS